MVLPDELASNFKAELRRDEEAGRMRYVTSIERLAKEEGKIETNRENIIKILQTRFGTIPKLTVDAINSINDLSVLETLFINAVTIASVDAFVQLVDETQA
jgi:hypothetical protein